jgi:hypothetical protein
MEKCGNLRAIPGKYYLRIEIKRNIKKLFVRLQTIDSMARMNRLIRSLLVLLFGAAQVLAVDSSAAEAVQAHADVPLQTDPALSFWSGAHPIYLEKDTQGTITPGFRTEVRVRWTKGNLYFLFMCPYDELHLKPAPSITSETNELWQWDVAEVFIGSNFSDIKRYQEFEVSPQGEWVDLDIDLNKPHHEDGWTWNSGFEASARIDPVGDRWYAAMRIPSSAIDKRSPEAGNEFRRTCF